MSLSSSGGRAPRGVQAHATLLDTLRAQQEAAARALDEYKTITSKAEGLFRDAVADAKRVGGKTEANVDRVLDRRKELLESEKKSQERYHAKLRDSVEEVNRALQYVTEASDALTLKAR